MLTIVALGCGCGIAAGRTLLLRSARLGARPFDRLADWCFRHVYVPLLLGACAVVLICAPDLIRVVLLLVVAVCLWATLIRSAVAADRLGTFDSLPSPFRAGLRHVWAAAVVAVLLLQQVPVLCLTYRAFPYGVCSLYPMLLGARALPFLEREALSPHSEVRASALIALSEDRDRIGVDRASLVELLTHALSDPSGEVRASARERLTGITAPPLQPDRRSPPGEASTPDRRL